MSAEEERSIAEQLHAYKIQEEEDELKISELTERLQVEKKEHALALQQKDKKIQRLQMQIGESDFLAIISISVYSATFLAMSSSLTC